jgi:hypothetical protein
MVLPGKQADSTFTPGAAIGTVEPKLLNEARVSLESTAATGRMQEPTAGSPARLAGLQRVGGRGQIEAVSGSQHHERSSECPAEWILHMLTQHSQSAAYHDTPKQQCLSQACSR